jgi:hypothetical protein
MPAEAQRRTTHRGLAISVRHEGLSRASTKSILANSTESLKSSCRSSSQRRRRTSHAASQKLDQAEINISEESDGEGTASLHWSPRTLWLKLAFDLDADLLVPGTSTVCCLYESPAAERACYWAWWAKFWFNQSAYDSVEMRSMYTSQRHSMNGTGRCSKRVRQSKAAASSQTSTLYETGSVLHMLSQMRRMTPLHSCFASHETPQTVKRRKISTPTVDTHASHSPVPMHRHVSSLKGGFWCDKGAIDVKVGVDGEGCAGSKGCGKGAGWVITRDLSSPPCEGRGAHYPRDDRIFSETARTLKNPHKYAGAAGRGEVPTDIGLHPRAVTQQQLAEAATKLCARIQEEAKLKGLRIHSQRDPLCRDCWEERPLAVGRYGQVVLLKVRWRDVRYEETLVVSSLLTSVR